ncbi:MAG: hypothetical protein WDO73_08580 [Ignavibacteriota bacterium]
MATIRTPSGSPVTVRRSSTQACRPHSDLIVRGDGKAEGGPAAMEALLALPETADRGLLL